MTTVIPQRELRNNVGEVLRRAEAGEVFTVTVGGRAVAQLTPLPGNEVRGGAEALEALRALPADPEWLAEHLAERDAERAAAVKSWR